MRSVKLLRHGALSGVIVGAAASLALLWTSPPARAQGCITRMPVSWSISSRYAVRWVKRMRIRLHSDGPRITDLTVSLYTFHGDLLGRGTLRSLSSNATVSLRLRYAMQPGAYTLYFYGYPNANPSCGPKHGSSILRLVGCGSSLPVALLDATQGSAAAYGGYYSFDVQSRGGELLRGLAASLSSFSGELLGTVRISILFGSLRVSIPLNAPIEPGGYTLDVSGYDPGRPRACGPAQAIRTLVFH